MHKDKEENSHHDSHYRARELAALAAYDHHHLDGEMFLQVSTLVECAHYVEQPIFTTSFGCAKFKKCISAWRARAHIYRMPWWETPASSSLSIDRLNSLTVAEKSICHERDLVSDPRPRNKWRRRVAWNIQAIYDAMCLSLVTEVRITSYGLMTLSAVQMFHAYVYILFTYIFY